MRNKILKAKRTGFFMLLPEKNILKYVSGSDGFTIEIQASSRETREVLLFFLGNFTLFIKVPYSSILLKSKGLMRRGAIQLWDECQKLVL